MTAPPLTEKYVTADKYLAAEALAETKSEYVDGRVVNMSGASPEHVTIATNLAGALYPLLKPAGCRGFTSDLRVRLQASNRYYYPDFTIVSGQPGFETVQGIQSAVNPTVIVEILSETTERRDRGEKWLAYMQMDSLRAYLLVHQDRPLIEIYSRESPADGWEFRVVNGLDSSLQLPTINAAVGLAAIYTDVTFDAP